MSAFENAVAALQARACPTCRGRGEVNDAEPADLCCSFCVCETCAGSGFAPLALGSTLGSRAEALAQLAALTPDLIEEAKRIIRVGVREDVAAMLASLKRAP